MTEDALAQTWQDFRETRDVALRNALVEEYLPVVRRVVWRLIRKLPLRLRVEDLESVGNMSLIQAVEDYDAGRLSNFEGWAKMVIRNDILNELTTFYCRKRPWQMSDMKRVPDKKWVSPELRLLMQDILDSVAAHLKGFSQRDRLILFFLHYEELSLAETAAKLGLSLWKVAMAHKEVILKLRGIFEVKELKMERLNRPRVARDRRFKRKVRELPLGVTPFKERFQARACLNGKAVYLGLYDTPEAASIAYQRAVGTP